MIKYRLVENARQRSNDYKDGDPCTVGYRFFDEQVYQNAKRWLEARGIEYKDNGFVDDFHVFCTCYAEADSTMVFRGLSNIEPIRVCVTSSHMVDLL